MSAQRHMPQDDGRREYIRCRTPWCRQVLGWQLGAGRLYWLAPVETMPEQGHFTASCPVCTAKRVWTVVRTLTGAER